MSLKFVSYGMVKTATDVGVASSLYEKYTALDGQTTFSLAGSYRTGIYELEVYLNGVRQILGTDYLEVDEKTVQFVEPTVAGETVLFTVQEVRNSSLYQEFTATEGQTIFTLSSAYHPKYNSLQVYDNGILLRIVDDYNEIDEKTVELTYPAVKDSKITFREIL